MTKPLVRNLLGNSAALVTARATSLLASAALLPYLIRDLTPSTYGAWATIASGTALLSFADLGVGRSLVNPLTLALTQKDLPRIRRLISTNMALLFACGSLVYAMIVLGVHLLPWQDFLSVTSSDKTLLTSIALIQAALFATTLALSTSTYVRLAQHRSARAAGITGLASLFAAAATLVAIKTNASVLAITSLAAAGPMVAAVLVTLDLLLSEAFARPAHRFLDRGIARTCLSSGLLFSVLTVSAALAFTADTLVVSNALGPIAVTQYTVIGRAPLALIALIQAGTIPLWPMIHSQHAAGEAIRTILGKAGLLFLVPACLASVAFYFGAQPITSYLGAGKVNLDRSLVLSLGAWIVVSTAGAILGHTLVGVGRLRLLALIAAGMAGSNLVLSAILVRHWGVSGVMWATVISYTLVTFPLSILGLGRRRSR